MNFAEDIILENAQVRLEPIGWQHFDALLAVALASPNLLQFSPSPFGTPEKMRENFEMAIQAREQKQRYAFAIFDKRADRFVGSTSFANISTFDARLEIGWTWLDKQVQGSGINQQCKFLLLSYAFENLGMIRVEFRTDSRNLQSRKAIEKIGGQYEGTLRSHMQMLDGARRDSCYYSILAEEWPAIKASRFAF